VDPSAILWGFPLFQHNPTSLFYLEQDVYIYNVNIETRSLNVFTSSAILTT